MEYLKSTWYVAAFGNEISAALFERRICDEPDAAERARAAA